MPPIPDRFHAWGPWERYVVDLGPMEGEWQLSRCTHHWCDSFQLRSREPRDRPGDIARITAALELRAAREVPLWPA